MSPAADGSVLLLGCVKPQMWGCGFVGLHKGGGWSGARFRRRSTLAGSSREISDPGGGGLAVAPAQRAQPTVVPRSAHAQATLSSPWGGGGWSGERRVAAPPTQGTGPVVVAGRRSRPLPAGSGALRVYVWLAAMALGPLWALWGGATALGRPRSRHGRAVPVGSPALPNTKTRLQAATLRVYLSRGGTPRRERPSP